MALSFAIRVSRLASGWSNVWLAALTCLSIHDWGENDPCSAKPHAEKVSDQGFRVMVLTALKLAWTCRP
jgi:hypothetical protein